MAENVVSNGTQMTRMVMINYDKNSGLIRMDYLKQKIILIIQNQRYQRSIKIKNYLPTLLPS